MSGGGNMEIDITSLLNGNRQLDIEKQVEIPKEYYQNTDIKDSQDITATGILTIDEENITLNLKVNGVMKLADSISLEVENYPFTSEIEEKIPLNREKMKNTLDITEILWQNIMLEVPLRFTKVEDYSKYQGDGWKLVKEEELKGSNNPFNDLKKMMGEE